MSKIIGEFSSIVSKIDPIKEANTSKGAGHHVIHLVNRTEPNRHTTYLEILTIR